MALLYLQDAALATWRADIAPTGKLKLVSASGSPTTVRLNAPGGTSWELSVASGADDIVATPITAGIYPSLYEFEGAGNRGLLSIADGGILQLRVWLSTIAVSSPFSATPEEFNLYCFGEQSNEVKKFRVVSIGRSHMDNKFVIRGVEYNPDVYTDLEPPQLPSASYSQQIAVSNLTLREISNPTPQQPAIAVGWTPGKYTVGAYVYITKKEGGVWGLESLAAKVDRQNGLIINAYTGEYALIRVVGYDAEGRTAPHSSAPAEEISISGLDLIPSNVYNFRATSVSLPNVTLGWDAVPEAAGDASLIYEIRHSFMTAGVPWERAQTVTTVDHNATSYAASNDWGTYLIKAKNGAGYWSGVAASWFIPAASGGGALPDPDPNPDPLPKGDGEPPMQE